MDTFITNLKYAIRNRETVTIGGGEFTHEELKQVLEEIQKLRLSSKENTK